MPGCVPRCAEGRYLVAARPARFHGGQAKVSDLHGEIVVQEYVVRLQVTVNDVLQEQFVLQIWRN